ncbi:hypothetical protein JCM31598_24260 [Desulfonatronum parangueonense]
MDVFWAQDKDVIRQIMPMQTRILRVNRMCQPPENVVDNERGRDERIVGRLSFRSDALDQMSWVSFVD